MKEEQLSETGWSLDADPPESVNNDTINDRLGLDENSLISVSSSSANTVSTYSTNSRYNQKPTLPTPILPVAVSSAPASAAVLQPSVDQVRVTFHRSIPLCMLKCSQFSHRSLMHTTNIYESKSL